MSRHPRFKRTKQVPKIELTDRDREIIRLVHQHRFLRSSHIVVLTGASPQSVLRRLQLLFHHGYLERPRAQLEYFHKGGSKPMVYGLGKKGVSCLKNSFRGTVHQARWSEKNRAIGRMFLEHALLVSDVMVAIETACRNAGIRFISQEELAKEVLPKSRAFRWKATISGGIKLGVIPDRVFALETPGNVGKAPERRYFFLEADRGTMPVTRRHLSQTSFFRKLLAYEATWLQKLHTSLFGFRRMRVLVVTTSAKRSVSILDACTKVERGRGLFLVSDRETLLNCPDVLSLPFQTTDGTSTLSD